MILEPLNDNHRLVLIIVIILNIIAIKSLKDLKMFVYKLKKHINLILNYCGNRGLFINNMYLYINPSPSH